MNVAKSILALTPARIDWWFVVRSSLGVAIALGAGLATGSSLHAVAAGIGALSVGFVSMNGFYRTRAGVMLATAAAMAGCAFVAGLAGPSTAAIVIVVAATGYAYGLLSSLGAGASGIGLNSVIAAIILGNIGTPPSQAPEIAGLVLAGGLVQTLLLVAAWPVGHHRAERNALADAYAALAGFARALAGGTAPVLPEHDALVAARVALADPQPFGRRVELAALQTLADEAERIRATLTLLPASAREDAEMARATADVLDAIARSLRAARTPVAAEAWSRADAGLERDRAWERLYGQIRSAWRSAAFPAGAAGRAAPAPLALVPHAEDWWRVLRANASFDSPFGRHALRLAAALGVAVLLYRLTHVERGYWIALTAAIVMRPDYTSTLARGFARIAGTIVGALLASAIALAVPLAPRVDVALAIACAALGYLTFPLNYALYSVTLTAYVVFLLSLIGLSEATATVDRIFATCVGGALGMLAYNVWPTWESPLTRAQMAGLLELDREFAMAMLGQYAGEPPIAEARLNRMRSEIWKARTQAAASVERMLGEPRRTYEIEPRQALAILAAEQRFALANVALKEAFAAGAQPLPALAVREFAERLDAAAASIEAALREGGRPKAYPALRDAYLALAGAAGAAPGDAARALLAQCDLYVDSLNTIAEAL